VVFARDLEQLPPTPLTWLWHGYLGPGKVTLLTSQWKSGKTTLVSRLLARAQQGGGALAVPLEHHESCGGSREGVEAGTGEAVQG
jgi:hypothetical protein